VHLHVSSQSEQDCSLFEETQFRAAPAGVPPSPEETLVKTSLGARLLLRLDRPITEKMIAAYIEQQKKALPKDVFTISDEQLASDE